LEIISKKEKKGGKMPYNPDLQLAIGKYLWSYHLHLELIAQLRVSGQHTTADILERNFKQISDALGRAKAMNLHLKNSQTAPVSVPSGLFTDEQDDG